jgi:hypothetical protein
MPLTEDDYMQFIVILVPVLVGATGWAYRNWTGDISYEGFFFMTSLFMFIAAILYVTFYEYPGGKK